MPGIIEYPKLVQEALAQYSDLFANECQRRHFAEYLTGLMVAERKTVLGIKPPLPAETECGEQRVPGDGSRHADEDVLHGGQEPVGHVAPHRHPAAQRPTAQIVSAANRFLRQAASGAAAKGTDRSSARKPLARAVLIG